MTPNELHHIRVKILGLTQTELAVRLGVTERTVSNWEHGRTTIRDMIALALRALAEEKR